METYLATMQRLAREGGAETVGLGQRNFPWPPQCDLIGGALGGAALVPLLGWLAEPMAAETLGAAAALGGLAGLVLGGGLAIPHALGRRRMDALRLHLDVIERALSDTRRELETEKWRSEKLSAALTDGEQRLRETLDPTSDWFWEMGPDLRFTYVLEMREPSGMGLAVLALGKAPWEFACEQSDPDAWAEHRRELGQRRPFRRMRYHVIRRDFGEHVFELTGNPIRDSRGRFVGYRGSAVDIGRLGERAPVDRKGILEAASSATTLFLRGQRWEDAIEDVCGKVGPALGISRVFACRNNLAEGDNRAFRLIHEWTTDSSPGAASDPDRPHWVFWCEVGLEPIRDLLARGLSYSAFSNELPPAFRIGLESWQSCSVLLVPVFVRGLWWGFVGLEDAARDRAWSAVERGSLKAVASALATAVARQDSWQARLPGLAPGEDGCASAGPVAGEHAAAEAEPELPFPERESLGGQTPSA